MSYGPAHGKARTYTGADEMVGFGGDITIGSKGSPGSETTDYDPNIHGDLPQYTSKGPVVTDTEGTDDDKGSVSKMRAPLKARIKKIKASMAKNYKKG